MRYTGARQAPVTYYANGHPYPAANTPKWRIFDAKLEDVEHLLAMGVFTEIGRAPKPAEPKPVAPVPIVPPQAVATPIAPPQVSNDAMQKAIAAMEAATKETIQPRAPQPKAVEPEKPKLYRGKAKRAK